VKDEDGRTALIMATLDKLEHVEVVTNLIQWGVEVNTRDKNGWTALMHACRRGFVETAKALLAAGADATVSTDDGKTALTLAEQAKNPELVSLLKQKTGVP
jgi:hypothetical protein